MKFDVAPPLTPLLNDAREAFEGADVVIAVGYSFADADVYITRMLSKSMQSRDSQKLLIVDPDSAIVDKLKLRFNHSIPRFDTERILYAHQGCEAFLPQFLAGELIEKDKELKPAGRRRPLVRLEKQRASVSQIAGQGAHNLSRPRLRAKEGKQSILPLPHLPHTRVTISAGGQLVPCQTKAEWRDRA